MGFSLSATNDEAAVLTAIGSFVGGMALAHMGAFQSAEIAILAGLGVLGYSGYSSPAAPAAAAVVTTAGAA